MKTLKLTWLTASFVVSLFLLNGCSNMPKTGGDESKELSYTGPTILNPRTIPEKVELNKNLQPSQPVQVLADVKDFRSPITSVKLKFINVPLELPMQRMAGTTWSVRVPPERLKDLAVAGQTMNYDATIIATNEKGQEAVSSKNVVVSVAAPELVHSTG